jgi:glycosyltransferase involved in cell wall biosynthesis
VVAWEALFVRTAHAVVTPSPAYADVIARRYRVRRPAVVRNIPEVRAVGRREPARDSRVVYIGGIMPGRGLEVAVKALVEIPNAMLEVIGPGRPEYRAEVMALANRLGVANRVVLRDPVPPAEVMDVLLGATAGLALIEPICLSYRLTLPNKLFEYLLAGVPVIASRLPAIEDVIAETGAGVLADPGDAGSVARAIEQAQARKEELSARAAAAATRFSAQNEADELMRVHAEAMRR